MGIFNCVRIVARQYQWVGNDYTDTLIKAMLGVVSESELLRVREGPFFVFVIFK